MATEEKKDFILDMVAKDQAKGYCEVPITRFPPEPNGYLHIGQAKAICLDFGLAKEYAHLGAVCHLRFDDTNPCKEDIEFVNSIQEDIHWLGFDWGEHLYWAPNIFDFYYDCAVALIKKRSGLCRPAGPRNHAPSTPCSTAPWGFPREPWACIPGTSIKLSISPTSPPVRILSLKNTLK